MKKILISCVNHHTNQLLYDYLDSIIECYNNCSNTFILEILVVNNVDKKNLININTLGNIKLYLLNNYENDGYVGGITKGLTYFNIDLKEYDFFIISNVDLLIKKTFFEILINNNYSQNVGWIAPKIYSFFEKKDRNPKITNRPSKMKINLLIFMYRLPFILFLYKNLIYKNKYRKNIVTNQKIYAGHGSFMIFSKAFLTLNQNFRFPSFLFGEEIYFAELNKLSNLEVIYDQSLEINDIDHSSTSKIKKTILYSFNYRSLKILKNIFFK